MLDLDNLYKILEHERDILSKKLNDVQEQLEIVTKAKRIAEDRKDREGSQQTTYDYSGLKFKDAVLELLALSNKRWEPAEIAKELISGGFSTKSKSFGNTVRASLVQLRKKGAVESELTKKGKQTVWVYYKY